MKDEITRLTIDYKNKILEYTKDIKRLKERYDHDKMEYFKGYKVLLDENHSKEKQITTIKNNMVIKDKELKSIKSKIDKDRDLSNGRSNSKGKLSKGQEKGRNGHSNNGNYISRSRTQSNFDNRNNLVNQKSLLFKINQEIDDLEQKISSNDSRNILIQKIKESARDKHQSNNNNKENDIENYQEEDPISITQIGENVFHLERSTAELKMNHKTTLSKLNVNSYNN